MSHAPVGGPGIMGTLSDDITLGRPHQTRRVQRGRLSLRPLVILLALVYFVQPTIAATIW